MRLQLLVYFLASFLGTTARAHFQFFEHVFGGGHHHQHAGPQNAPSDPSSYQQNYERTYCENYLCPDTLACVHFPHHCPCPWEAHQDKMETGEGHRICASRGGYKEKETVRKIELARQGQL